SAREPMCWPGDCQTLVRPFLPIERQGRWPPVRNRLFRHQRLAWACEGESLMPKLSEWLGRVVCDVLISADSATPTPYEDLAAASSRPQCRKTKNVPACKALAVYRRDGGGRLCNSRRYKEARDELREISSGRGGHTS